MTRVPTLPFPALLTNGEGLRIGPAKLEMRAGDDAANPPLPPRLRAFVIRPDGRGVVLALDTTLTEPIAATTRQQRTLVAHTDSGDWTIGKGGCACGSRRLLLTFDPATWDAEVTG